MSKSFLCITLLLCALVSNGQDKTRAFFFGYSANSYSGDLSGYGRFNNAFNAGVSLNQNRKLSGELNVRIGTIIGESLEVISPVERYVQSTYFSLNYGVNVRLLNWKNKFKINIIPGIGLMRFTPKDFEKNELANQNDSRKRGEEYSNITLILPLKFQFHYEITPLVAISYDLGFLNSRTDYLDNLSELADPSDKDNVMLMNFNVFLRFKNNRQQVDSMVYKLP